MQGQITLTEWMQWREDIRRKLQETASNFVYIGYRLKQIRDSGMYDGCSDIFEFAQKEYGLGKSITSRFIAINEKFSEGGNSLEIREEYKALGSSKLSEMLTLSEEDCRLITAQTTVKEIREMKHFNKQEPELEDEVEVIQYTPLQKCIIDFFKGQKEALNEVMYLLDDGWQIEEAVKVINPGNYITHKKGIVFLFMYDFKNGVSYKIMGQPEPVKMFWSDFFYEVSRIYEGYYDEKNIDKTWNKFYHVEIEEKTEVKTPENRENTAVATSQQNTEKRQELTPKKAVEITEKTEEKEETNHYGEVTEMVDEDPITEVNNMEVEETMESVDKAMEADEEEPVPAAEPEKKTNSEWKSQINRCFSNLQTEINAESWNAALTTIKHMEHYINMAMKEEGTV